MTDIPDLLVKIPTRSRPDRFFNVFREWQCKLSGTFAVKFMVTIDSDDSTMNNPETLTRLDESGVHVRVGNCKTKIEAINDGVYDVQWSTLIAAADDMVPQVDAYDAIILDDMRNKFPDTDGALHYDDGIQGQRLCVLPILGRKYFERFGYVYHQDYASLYCDNEYTEVGKRLQRLPYIHKSIIKHLHPSVAGGFPADELLRRNNALVGRDRSVYLRRKAAGFPSKSVLSFARVVRYK